MLNKTIFVTGTDTGVGKTTVSSAIAAAMARRGLRVAVFKPAETGCDMAPDGRLVAADAERLRFFASAEQPAETVCLYKFTKPLAPAVAAALDGISIDMARLRAAHDELVDTHDITLVEGAGGLLVPLTATLSFLDLAVLLRSPLLIVVGSKLGCINHALLTYRVARAAGLTVLGYVMNALVHDGDLSTHSNADVLSQWLGPPLGSLPFVDRLMMNEATRLQLAELAETNIALERLL